MAPPGKKLPWPIALLILAVLALVVGWFASFELRAFHREHPRGDQKAAIQANATPSIRAPSLAPRAMATRPKHPAA